MANNVRMRYPRFYPVLIVLVVATLFSAYWVVRRSKMSTYMAGGFGEEKIATEHEQGLVDALRVLILQNASISPDSELVALKFKSQVVAGMNYIIKALASSGQVVHVKIHVPLPYTNNPAELMDLKTGVTRESPIEFF